jgi:hypothetical protein
MTADPLVLYLADSIDARAGAELLRERWAGAELVATPAYQRALLGDQHTVWYLGLGVDFSGHPDGADCHALVPAPTASIAMQVWRELRSCETCQAMGDHGCNAGPEHCYHGTPPWWLRYLDDAVCGRWALPDSRAVWAAVEAWEPAGCDPMFWQHLISVEDTRAGFVHSGRAILRDRKRRGMERLCRFCESEPATTCQVCIDDAPPEDISNMVSDLERTTARLRQWIDDLQAGCYINCVYCGHRYGPDSEVPASMAEALKEHIEQCPEHPLSAATGEMARLRAERDEEKAEADKLRAILRKAGVGRG